MPENVTTTAQSGGFWQVEGVEVVQFLRRGFAYSVEAAASGKCRVFLNARQSVERDLRAGMIAHGKGAVEDDIRAFGMNKERGGIARQFVLGIVQTADGLLLMHTVHPGNVAETKTLQAMLETVLKRFPIDRVILVADRGLLSLDNIHHLTDMANQGGRKLEFILAVPAKRYGELTGAFRELSFDQDGLAEAQFADHRLIVAHDPLRAAEQSDKRCARIAELEAMADKMVTKLDAQEFGPDHAATNPPGEDLGQNGKTTQGRRASDRGAWASGDAFSSSLMSSL